MNSLSEENENNISISKMSLKLFDLPEKPVSKHQFEYQELAESLEPIYGRAIWSLFHKVGFTEYKIKKAHDIASEKGITKLSYLIGIIKHLP